MRIENGGGFRLETETSVGYLEFNATARRYEFQATWQPETEGPFRFLGGGCKVRDSIGQLDTGDGIWLVTRVLNTI